MARPDPSQVLDEVMTLEHALAETFAASPLALALIGMYGLLTHSLD